MTPVTTEQLMVLAAQAPKPTPTASRNGHVNGHHRLDVEERARRYLAKMPGGIAGENGSGPTFAAACALVLDFAMAPEEAFPILDEWSQNYCQPPWSEGELRHKLADADKRPGERGRLLNGSTDGLSHGVVENAGAAQDSKPAIRFERLTSAELDATKYSQQFLIEGVLVAGQPGILAGAKKSLKTSFTVDAAISLAVGGYFLGKFKVNRACRVLVMSGESGLATLQETARRVAAAAGYKLGDIRDLIWSPTLPQLDQTAHLEALREFLTENETEVLFLDPAYLCMPGSDAANLFIQGSMLRGTSALCQQLGITLVLVHHTKQGSRARDQFAVPGLDDIAWAGFGEWARQWLLVGRREKYEPGTGEHRLWLSVGGSAGHSALWAVDVSEGVVSEGSARCWKVKVVPPDKARSDAEQRKDDAKAAKDAEKRDKVLDALRGSPLGLNRTDLQKQTGMSGRELNEAFYAELVRLGDIEECEVSAKGKKKQPDDGFRLVNQGSNE